MSKKDNRLNEGGKNCLAWVTCINQKTSLHKKWSYPSNWWKGPRGREGMVGRSQNWSHARPTEQRYGSWPTDICGHGSKLHGRGSNLSLKGNPLICVLPRWVIFFPMTLWCTSMKMLFLSYEEKEEAPLCFFQAVFSERDLFSTMRDRRKEG